MSKEVILTGIRANNDLHIGNYFGALLPIVDMAKERSSEYEINLFVPDLHSFTTPIDHTKLFAQTMHNLNLFAAAGLPLDNPSIHIYRQSYIPAHSEMTWIMDCFTGFGELSKMTQFRQKSFAPIHEGTLIGILGPIAQMKTDRLNEKDARMVVNIFRRLEEAAGPIGDSYALEALTLLKGGKITLESTQAHSIIRAYQDKTEGMNQIGQVTVGLFNYPVLMAADILLYGARYVPVGDDQSQHLEFTRDIAERMNSKFGELFKLPEPVVKQHEFFGKDQGLRIKDLADPTKKMSKSDTSDKGVIFLGDDPEVAARKVMSATTDSFTDGIKFNPTERPGVANLLQIYDLLQPGNRDKMLALPDYKALKETVAQEIQHFLTDFQTKLSAVEPTAITQKLETDEADMNKVANHTLLKVQQAVGLRPKS